MPRPPRVEYSDALYHVTSRGNARQTLFHTDHDRQRFLIQLQDNLESYGVVLYAWVLMTNHFHLVVRTPRANLSRFMQRLNSSYSLYYRCKHGKPGHVLGGRYKAPAIEDEEYLLAVTRYVHLNPIKTGEQKRRTRAERVGYLEAYGWSSYPAYAGKATFPDWMSDHVLRGYGRTRKEAHRRYRAYALAGVLEVDTPIVELMRASPYAIGGEEFVERIEKTLRDRSRGDALDADVSLPWRGVELDVIDRVVCEKYGIRPEDLRLHGHAVGEAKLVAVELAARRSGKTLRAIGALYGGITGQAVAMIRQRARREKRVDWREMEQVLEGG